MNQQVGQEILHRMGLQLDIAENGLRALKKLEEAEYDIVLMNVDTADKLKIALST
jgi:two-component system, sensor histidine kinase and response regulator